MKPSLWRRIKRAWEYPKFVRQSYRQIILSEEKNARDYMRLAERWDEMTEEFGVDYRLAAERCRDQANESAESALQLRRDVFLEDV